MNSQELRNLQEAYIDVYEGTHPDIEGQTEFASKVEAILASRKKRREQDTSTQKHGTLRQEYRDAIRRGEEILAARKAENRARGTQKEETDLYDIILSHLLDEGYAETQEQAEVIMVNMSEDWRESIVEGRVAWDDKKNPNPSGYTPKEKSEAKRRQLGVDDPNTSSFEKGGPGEKEYARHGNLAATQEKMKKRSNQPKGKPHQFRKNPFWKMDLGQVKREIFGTDVPKNKRSSYEGKNMPSFTKD
jgi:hypothetical protein